ncbi:hypothetical protein HPP92_012069 [Vanilla planifolia]|uniref:Uncharacterized protein n=1 Tax=Vanilla planifolia TaxID=51239 RepID=A0A835V513_VANPL|nr:hypothetical protein HPP92_012069 [Vanilla planifolia]
MNFQLQQEQLFSVFYSQSDHSFGNEVGILYLLQLNENSQPIWSDLVLNIEPRIESAEAEAEASTTMVIKTGAVSHDGELPENSSGKTVEALQIQVSSFGPVKVPRDSNEAITAVIKGSIFMVSENGGLVEYHWNTMYGWEWVEHGTPAMGIILVGDSGPCLGQFRVVCDWVKWLCLYRRQLYERTWRWTNYGIFQGTILRKWVTTKAFYGENGHNSETYKEYCNQKGGTVRPIPFSEDSLVFELQDGRDPDRIKRNVGKLFEVNQTSTEQIAELRRSNQEVSTWEWVRIIGTPNSICLTNYWTAVAS